LWQLIKGKKLDADFPLFKRPIRLPVWERTASLLCACRCYFYIYKLLGHFLLYWLLPLLTIMQVIVRWGAICEHHYFPGIPFSSLPKVHEIFQREGLINELNVFHGNLSYLRFLLKNEPD
jgi:hypothetical protein